MILVTGGAGYIGSHTVKMLIEKGKDILVLDNLSRGFKEAINSKAEFENADLLDYYSLENVIKKYNIESVIHFAAFAYVGESVENPQLYYNNNVVGSFNLIKAITAKGIKKFVFSSTCSTYGNPVQIPISESETTKPINPYAKTKLMIENILEDFNTAYGLNYVALRYFNAAGCSEDGDIGESHNPEPHLIPLVLQSMTEKTRQLKIFGDDYETPDGTCIRDYIHVNDLADAHIRALDFLNNNDNPVVINLGTGDGNSVKDIINTSENVTGKKANFVINPRRPGDPAILVADNKKAKEVLGWTPKYKLDKIIETAWKWHLNKKY
ncbi:MAG: UDP-glucose 4-epimerase GalE [Candidatus Kapaibacterium sp.]